MDTTATSTIAGGMPAQKVPDSKKSGKNGEVTDWGRQCVNYLAGARGAYYQRLTPTQKQENYDLVSGKLKEESYTYFTDPIGNKGEFGGMPAKLRNYSLIVPKLEELAGEEILRPFSFRAYATDGGALTRSKARLMQLAEQNLQALLAQSLGAEAEQPEVPLPALQEYMSGPHEDQAEKGANQILKHLRDKLQLIRKFHEGFDDVRAVAEEIYWVGESRGEPDVRVVNPLYFEFEKSAESPFIHDSQWGREVRWLTVGQVIDEYGEYLSDSEIKRIENRELGVSPYLDPGYSHSHEITENEQIHTGTAINRDSDTLVYAGTVSDSPFPRYAGLYQSEGGLASNNLIPVICCGWRSLRQVTYVRYPDPQTGDVQERRIEGVVKLSAAEQAQGWSASSQWEGDIWEGVRIGGDIFPYIRPLANQTGRLPWTGMVYAGRNSAPVSLVDRGKSLQELYNHLLFKFEDELAKNKGKVIIMDAAFMPQQLGGVPFSPERWAQEMLQMQILWIDSSREGADPRQAQAYANQIQGVDLSAGAALTQIINGMGKIEEMIGSILGVSRQREGNVTSSETVGGVERAVRQSSNITEKLFYFHDLVKREVLTSLVEVAKVCYLDGFHGQYVVDEGYREWLKVDGARLADSAYGIFIGNTGPTAHTLEQLQQMGQVALQQGAITLTELADMMATESASEARTILRKGEERRQQQQQAAQQADQQTKQADIQARQQMQAEEQAWQAEQNQFERDNKLRIAELSTLRGKDGPSDMDSDGVPDAIAQGEFFLKQQAQTSKQALDVWKARAQMQGQQDKAQADQQKMMLAMAKEQREQQRTAEDSRRADAEAARNAKEQQQQNRMHADQMKAQAKELQFKKQQHQDKVQLEKRKLKVAARKPASK